MFDNNLVWDKGKYNEYLNLLNNNKEGKSFVDFSKKIIFTEYKILGIKVPNMRKIAKDISKTNIFSFLDIVESNTYEEVMIEGLVISYINDINRFIEYFDNFIRKIDNWAICDTCISSMKIVKKNKEKFLVKIKEYLKSENEFIVRVGIILLLDYYIDDEYIDLIFDIIDSINRDEYYINMAIAWIVSVCFIKYKDKTYKYLNKNNLDKFTYNKAIQKMIESLRVSKEDKNILKQMKRV